MQNYKKCSTVRESLNVSVAAACILQRVTERKRTERGGGDLSAERQAEFFEEWRVREIAAKQGMRARMREG